MILDYKNKTIFVTLIFQDVTYFIYIAISNITRRISWDIISPILICYICIDDGGDKLMAHQSTFSTGSLSMSKFIAFSDTKYFFHIIWYRASPAMMESPNRSMLGFVTFTVRQWFQWHLIQLDLLSAFKAIKNIPKYKADFDKICKVLFCNALNGNLWRYWIM